MEIHEIELSILMRWVVDVEALKIILQNLYIQKAKKLIYICVYIYIHTYIRSFMYFPRMLLLHEPSYSNM